MDGAQRTLHGSDAAAETNGWHEATDVSLAHHGPELHVVAGRACSAAAPIIGAASLCAWGLMISNRAAATAWVSIGRYDYEDLAPYYDKVEALIGVYRQQ